MHIRTAVYYALSEPKESRKALCARGKIRLHIRDSEIALDRNKQNISAEWMAIARKRLEYLKTFL